MVDAPFVNLWVEVPADEEDVRQQVHPSKDDDADSIDRAVIQLIDGHIAGREDVLLQRRRVKLIRSQEQSQQK